jgi:death-on-curing protein
VEVVREIHREVLAEFGGPDGVRDQGLLESAVAAPQASVAGESPFRDLVEIAAAYLFYLCRNHPFVDGNKRTAMAAAIVFLRLNGVEPSEDGEDWEELLVGVASSRLDRNQATLRLRRLVGRRR